MTTPNPVLLVQQIAQIQRMERGKLSIMSEGSEGTHYKHQVWENGKNVSRHIGCEQAAKVQEAIDGYQKFQVLTEEYAQQVIEKTRSELTGESKKKKYRQRRNSSWRKTRKSNS